MLATRRRLLRKVERRLPLRIYIAGPLSAPTHEGRAVNANVADLLARAAFIRGHVVFCPHTMSLNWYHDGRPEFHDYAAVVGRQDIGWLRLCDAVLLCPDWEGSKGTQMEVAEARRLGLPLWLSIGDVPDYRLRAEDGGAA